MTVPVKIAASLAFGGIGATLVITPPTVLLHPVPKVPLNQFA